MSVPPRIGATSFALSTQYQKHRSNLESSLARLSSGDRLSLPGAIPAELSLAERMRAQVRSQEMGRRNLQLNLSVLNTSEVYLDELNDILLRMTELAAAATQQSIDGNISENDTSSTLQNLDTEYQSLLQQYINVARGSSFSGKPLVGQESLVTFDAIAEKITYWDANGGHKQTLAQRFNSDAIDSNGVAIDFSGNTDFTMDIDGENLYYIANAGAGTYELRRYNIASQTVQAPIGLDADVQSKIYVDSDGSVYYSAKHNAADANYSIYRVNPNTMTRERISFSGTNLDDASTTDFVVANDTVHYIGQDAFSQDVIRTWDIETGNTTVSSSITTHSLSESSFSSDGRLLAAYDASTSTLYVNNTDTGTERSLVLTGLSINGENFQFNSDGDRIYYTNTNDKTLNYVNVTVGTDREVTLSPGENGIVQSAQVDNMQGLSLGGVSPSVNGIFATQLDPNATIEYKLADARLWRVGLVGSTIRTMNDASSALDDLRSAQSALNMQRSIVAGGASRIQLYLPAHNQSLAEQQAALDRIREVDVAKESSKVASLQVKTEAAMAVL
jgi:flagellin